MRSTETSELLLAVAETAPFSDDADRLLSEDERNELIAYLSCNPMAGDVIPKSGGIRKLRWSARGKGTRGGSRIIYFYHGLEMPLYLLAIYAKNEKVDLSAKELKALRGLSKDLVDAHATGKK